MRIASDNSTMRSCHRNGSIRPAAHFVLYSIIFLGCIPAHAQGIDVDAQTPAIGQTEASLRSTDQYKSQTRSDGDDYVAQAYGNEGYTDSQDASLGYRYGDRQSVDIYKANYSPTGSYRQPIAIAMIHDRLAVVPTKLTGEIYALRLPEKKLIELIHSDPTRQFGKLIRLCDTAFVVLDRLAGEALVFQSDAAPAPSERWSIVAKLSCPGAPHSLAWDGESGDLFITGQWSQRLYHFQNEFRRDGVATENASKIDPSRWKELPSTELPMCGGVVLPLKQHSVVLVMDAFGRDFAVVDCNSSKVIKHGEVYGHNISQIVAVDGGERIMFTHQLLNEFAQSMRGDITWGGLMSNAIRWLKTERLLTQTGSDIFSQGKFYPIGAVGDGAGDPTSFDLSVGGTIAVTLGGTNRVALADLHELDFRQFDVGFHPVACCFTSDQSQLIVVNQFSDSLSVVGVSDGTVEHLELGPLRFPTESEQGEQFFFHSKLAHDGWMSCHSCHSQGHTNGQLNDNLTDDSFSSPKRILSLLGQADTTPYSWNGKFEKLEEQVFHSIRSTMATDNPIDQAMVDAIAVYVRSLPSPPSVLMARGELDEHSNYLKAGNSLFQSLGCADCHGGTTYTSTEKFDVGLEDELGNRMFNPPSLLGISQRQSALFHDGRANSIQDVIVKFRHQMKRELSDQELKDLVYFLNSL